MFRIYSSKAHGSLTLSVVRRLLPVFLLLLLVVVGEAEASVVFFRYQNFTEGYSFEGSCDDLGPWVRTYQGTCTQSCCHGEDTRDVPCTKEASLNDDFRAIEITGDETVEIYEHKNRTGRYFRLQGPTKAVFPAWMWDRVTSFVIY